MFKMHACAETFYGSSSSLVPILCMTADYIYKHDKTITYGSRKGSHVQHMYRMERREG